MNKTLIIILMSINFLVGCTTVYQVPHSLLESQLAEIHDSPFSEIVVEIKRDDNNLFPDYIYKDVKTLFQESKLFKAVYASEEIKLQSDLIVETRSISNIPMCATPEASAMIMTLGIIPLSSDNQTYNFIIKNHDNSDFVDMQYTYIQKSHFGTLSSLLSISKNWSTSPQAHKNYELFAYNLVSIKEKILNLVDIRRISNHSLE